MFASMKKLDSLAYYDLIKDQNELKQYDENDEIYAEKHGIWYDKEGIYAKCFSDGEVIAQVKKGDTSTLNKFAQGYNPKTGEVLVEQKAGTSRRPGYDITQSVPKAVSVLYAQASPELRSKIEAAVMASAKAGIDALNDYAAMTVAGKGGKDRTKCYYAAALYMDFTGRPVMKPGGSEQIDPQLHVHCVLPNNTICEDNKHRGIEGSILMKAQTLVAAVGGAKLAEEMKRLGFQIEKREHGFGIKGISEEVCDEFSGRSKQVLENRKALGIPDVGTARGEFQAGKMTGRAHHSLATKDEIESAWDQRANALDFTKEAAEQLYQEAQQHAQKHAEELPEIPTDEDIMKVFDALLETESVVSDAKLRAACLKEFAGRAPLEDLIAQIDKTIAFETTELGRDGPYKMISSEKQITLENEMVDIAVNTQRKTVFDQKIVDQVIEKFKAEKIAEGKPMSAQQEEAVRFLAGSPDAVVAMVGRAGAGKSYTVACLQAIAEKSGFESTGVALSWAAARNLASEGKMAQAAAIADMAQQLKTGKLKLHEKSMIVIDEAGIVGSRDMHTILTAAKQSGALVVLAGDPLQITSVQAGGALRAIIAEKQFAGKEAYTELTEVRRQRQKWDAEAGLALAAGDAQKAIAEYIKNGREDYDGKDLGRLKMLENRDEMLGKVFEQYIADRFDGTGKSQLVIAQTNADVDTLNRRIHDELMARGVIGKDVAVTGGKKEAQDIMLSVGDEIQFRTKSSLIKAENGESVRVFNRTRAKVLDIEGAGADAKLRVQLFDGDKLSDVTLKISGQDFRDQRLPIEHSYVMTVDSAQGQTFDRSYIFGADMKDRARAYVAATRHRDELSIYCDKDTLHAIGEGRWSTGGFVNRSDMSNELAVDILAQSWSRNREKVTTLDYTSEALRKAEIEKNYLAKNELSQMLASMQLQSVQRGRAISLNAVPSENRIWPPNEHGYIGVEMPENLKDLEAVRKAIQKLDNALVSANQKFGQIKISGTQEFVDLCAKRIIAIRRSKNQEIKPLGGRLLQAIEKAEKAEMKVREEARKEAPKQKAPEKRDQQEEQQLHLQKPRV